MKEKGFYIVKDEFFADMADPFLKTNKDENRPHYYCFKDDGGIFWLVPLSSRIGKYRAIIDKRLAENKPCDILHIAKLDDGKENVFLIQDMFPITKEYIKREYTIAGNHLILTSDTTAEEIERKARKVMGLLRRGIKLMPTQPDIAAILEKLQQNKRSDRNGNQQL